MYSTDKVYIIIFINMFIFYLLVFKPYFNHIAISNTKDKMTTVQLVLENVKEENKEYPVSLLEIINSIAFERIKIIDAWNNEFYYKQLENKLKNTLVPKAIDGKLDTNDDIKQL